MSPLRLTNQELNRYSFNVQPLLAEIKTQNNFVKNSDPITPRLLFIGEATALQRSIGVFLAFISDDEQAEAELLGLRAKVGKTDGILVLCPSYEIQSQNLSSQLAGQNVVCRTFKAMFKGTGYKIDFSKVSFDHAADQPAQRLTAKQIEDYTKCKYQCYDQPHIPGTIPMKRSNVLTVNGHTIKMPDNIDRTGR